MLSTSPCTPGLTPPPQDPTAVWGLRPGRGRGRSSRLAGWTPLAVPRHEGPRGAGAHGPWGSLPTPQSRAAEVERPLPPKNPPPTLGAPDPAPPWRLCPPCPDPVCLVLPERLVSRISPFPPLPGPPGPSLSARGPRGGRLDTTSPPSFGRTGAGRGGGDAGAPRAWAGAGLGGGEAGLQPALRTSPAASFSARAAEPLHAGSGTRLYWGCGYPVFLPQHLPPLPSPPHSSEPLGRSRRGLKQH